MVTTFVLPSTRRNSFFKAPTAIQELCLSFLCYISADALLAALGPYGNGLRRLIVGNPRPDHVIDGAPTVQMLVGHPMLLWRSPTVDLFVLRQTWGNGCLTSDFKNIRTVYSPNSEAEFCDLPNVATVSGIAFGRQITFGRRSREISKSQDFKTDVWDRIKRIGFGDYMIPKGVVFSECTDVHYDLTVNREVDESQFPKLERAIAATIWNRPFPKASPAPRMAVVYTKTDPHKVVPNFVSRVDFCAEVPEGFSAPSVKVITIHADYHFLLASLSNLPPNLDALYLRGVHPDQIGDFIRLISKRLESLHTLVITADDGWECLYPVYDGLERLSASLKALYFSFGYREAELRPLLPGTMFLQADPEDRWWLPPRKYTGGHCGKYSFFVK